MWNYEGLHILSVLTVEDLTDWLSNDRTPENRRMIEYWIHLWNDKWYEAFREPMAAWDDVVFLHAIRFEWFLDDLYKRKGEA